MFLKIRKKQGKKMKEIGYGGLFLFVGIPSYGTGAYVGSVVSFMLGMNVWKSYIAIVFGIILQVCLSLAGLTSVKALISLINWNQVWMIIQPTVSMILRGWL